MRIVLVAAVLALAHPAAAVSMVEPTVDADGVPLGSRTAAGDNSLLACMVWINDNPNGQWLKPCCAEISRIRSLLAKALHQDETLSLREAWDLCWSASHFSSAAPCARAAFPPSTRAPAGSGVSAAAMSGGMRDASSRRSPRLGSPTTHRLLARADGQSTRRICTCRSISSSVILRVRKSSPVSRR